jgi:predicted component of type VI protein secretion system
MAARDDHFYLSVPLEPTRLFSGRSFERAELKESIANNIHLVLVTDYGEFSFDENYGCDIWERDFDTLPNTGIWTKAMAERLQATLETYETRLKDFVVKAEVDQIETTSEGGNRQMRRQLTVTIEAMMRSTDERFFFRDRIMISPFAIV